MISISLIKFKHSYTQNEVNKGGIYLIKCIANNKVYVGQAKWFIKRWLEHQGCLFKKSYGKSHLQNAYNKYGIDNFEFIIHEYLPNDLQQIASKYKATDIEYVPVVDWLNEKETYYIEKFRNELGERNVFNSTTGGDHPKPNTECKKVHSIAMKKVWKNESFREQMNESAFQNEELLKNQSETHKEKWKDPNYRKRNCETRRKTFSTTEYKEKRSAISKRIWEDEEKRKRHSEIEKESYRRRVEECDKQLALLYEDEPDVKKWSLRKKKDLIKSIAEELKMHPIN